MTVPGPGHVEQEIELHKSLIKDNDDVNHSFDGEVNIDDDLHSNLLEKQLQRVSAMAEAAEKALQS